MLRHYMQIWHLTAPQHLASTATSHVYMVQHHGHTVILKLLTPVGQEDEQGATAALVRWLCRKFCSGGREEAVAPVCGGIKRPRSRTVRPQ